MKKQQDDRCAGFRSLGRNRNKRSVSAAGYWVVRTYTSGNVGEKTKFWVQGERPVKAGRKEKTELRKQEQNEYAAEKQLARLINANFGAGDLLLGLDYSAEGMERIMRYLEKQGIDLKALSEEERIDAIRTAADREMQLVLRRVQRAMKQDGLELKYIGVTSDMDGDTGEMVRVHHHLIVPECAKGYFLEKWKGLGGVDWTELRRQPDYLPIAEYLLRQVRRIPDAKKYRPSRNLVRPQPKDRIVNSGAELRVPKGGQLLQRNAFRPGQAQYIRYILPEAMERETNTGLYANKGRPQNSNCGSNYQIGEFVSKRNDCPLCSTCTERGKAEHKNRK